VPKDYGPSYNKKVWRLYNVGDAQRVFGYHILGRGAPRAMGDDMFP